MDLGNIKKLSSSGESSVLEYKLSTAQLKPACETLTAFLNGDGGTVLIGVADNGAIVGQEVTDKTKRVIGNEIARITPLVQATVDYIKVPGSNKVVIVLAASPEQNKKPYMYDGKAYIRIESNTSIMPQEHYNHLLAAASQNNSNHWEDQVVEDITIDDLDHQEILNTIKEGMSKKEGMSNGRIPDDYATDDVKKALNHFRVMHNDNISAAAVVLFAKKPEKWLSQCVLKLARFRGISHIDDFVDSKQVFGNAFVLIREAMTFASRYLPIASYFPEGQLEREDVPLFPVKALREV